MKLRLGRDACLGNRLFCQYLNKLLINNYNYVNESTHSNFSNYIESKTGITYIKVNQESSEVVICENDIINNA